MGRSDKKIKSDRINALKKQYDAFLEEDKKRKERNEYILEKLDKMRYCTAVVQVRKKPGIVDNADYYNSQKQSLGSLVPTINQNHIPLKDESILIKQISKKYILIPKLRSIYTDSYAQEVNTKNDDNSDWKSKYDILEKLKKNEKETDIPTETYLHKPERDISEQIINADTTDQDGQPLFDYTQDSVQQMQSEHETPYEGISCVENNNYTESQPNVYFENYDKQEQDNINLNSHPEKLEDESDSQQMIQSSNLEPISNVKPVIPIKDNIGISDDKNYQFDDNQYTSESMCNYNESNINDNIDQRTNNNDNYPRVDDGLPIKIINPSEFVNEINNDIHPQLKTQEIEQLEYSHETISPQDFTSVDNSIQNEENIQSEQFVTNDSNTILNDNSGSVTNNNMEPTVDLVDPMIVDGTEPTEQVFEEGNNEQYYSEQVDENYVYNQEEAENYTQEYTAPTENYQQEEYNTYYEGAQPEQGFGEVNKNDDALQRYDQNYEEQYGAAYDGQQFEQQEYDQQYAQQGYDQQYVDQGQAEQLYSDQAQVVQQYSDQEQAEQHYSEQGKTEQHFNDQGQTEQHYTDQGQAEQHYTDQGPAELHYTDQNPVDQHYSEQAHEEQHYAERGQEYAQPQQQIGQAQPMYENNAPQIVEQQLDNEEGYIEKQNENIEINKIEKPLPKQKNEKQVKAQ